MYERGIREFEPGQHDGQQGYGQLLMDTHRDQQNQAHGALRRLDNL
ncbi:hypothetical protein GLIP_4151 [Aliiglaciecola lipolytica E3]|uniref:Uncharacterized protein n=1 Tax=Aliiglaciecola lipolytica E3 TaxID=1127673 RepID=K6YF24_9ALTE|nr:hypothetical protein GLIP_4151 [Aliiglaciecola lipolytica E3]